MSYLMDVGKRESAEMIFKGADILYPDNMTLWFNRGIDLNEAKINNKSVIYLERALALGADSANCYNNMATAVSQMGDMASAEEYFGEAARLNDQDPVIMRNYITVILYQGRYQDALDLIDLQLARDDIDSNYIAEIASFRKQYLKWRETQPNKDELPQ
jgi:Flp pilus assembly protein TadD